MTESERILAKTWNRNESGTLWTAEWYAVGRGEDARFYRRTIASGVFAQPRSFGNDVAAFWTAYGQEAAEFSGESVH